MKLQEIRKQKKLSQGQLADIAGIPRQVLQKYEMGYRDIDGASLDRLCDIALALDCKIYDIIESETVIQKLKKVM